MNLSPTDLDSFLNGLIAVNRAAKQAAGPFERKIWYRLKGHMLSTAILTLPADLVRVDYQWDEASGQVYVLVTVYAGEVRSFHLPFQALSGPAEIAVVEKLGNPYVFSKNARLACAGV
jgi:hypothetical protein